MIAAAHWNAASAWLEAILGFLYPNVCQICRQERAGVTDGYVCARCQSAPGAVRWLDPPLCSRCGLPYEGDITVDFVCSNCRDVEYHFSYARAAVAAKGLVLDVIHRYKYREALWFEPFLAGMLVQRAVPILGPGRWDYIVPVPLHPLKRRERGFNQAERLARRLGKAAGIRIGSGLVARKTHTRAQTRLTREERAANVKDAFQYTARGCLSGARVVVVDDVFTTGATTNACAKVLRANGAAEVCVWTVARGL